MEKASCVAISWSSNEGSDQQRPVEQHLTCYFPSSDVMKSMFVSPIIISRPGHEIVVTAPIS